VNRTQVLESLRETRPRASAIHDIIVIGASAGGVEALREVVSGLTPDLPAAIFVAMHIGRSESELPQILAAAGPLPSMRAVDGQPIVNGTIYVAPPDRHLLIEAGHMHLSRGPKENRARPAINPLFRSAALVYGPRVAGVILTGMLDDGVSGLWEIKRRGGVAIVQDPKEAVYPSMPYSATEHVAVDYVVRLSEIPALLSTLAVQDRGGAAPGEENMRSSAVNITCPECRGPLHEEQRGTLVEYRCRVGHAYSQVALADSHEETQERALWAAMVALEEGADIADGMSKLGREGYELKARRKRAQAAILRQMINDGEAGTSPEPE
jgi:two-component system chemotaxis response regulator CheB